MTAWDDDGGQLIDGPEWYVFYYYFFYQLNTLITRFTVTVTTRRRGRTDNLWMDQNGQALGEWLDVLKELDHVFWR